MYIQQEYIELFSGESLSLSLPSAHVVSLSFLSCGAYRKRHDFDVDVPVESTSLEKDHTVQLQSRVLAGGNFFAVPGLASWTTPSITVLDVPGASDGFDRCSSFGPHSFLPFFRKLYW